MCWAGGGEQECGVAGVQCGRGAVWQGPLGGTFRCSQVALLAREEELQHHHQVLWGALERMRVLDMVEVKVTVMVMVQHQQVLRPEGMGGRSNVCQLQWGSEEAVH